MELEKILPNDARLLPVDDSDYDMVRDMYITAGLPEFGIQE